MTIDNNIIERKAIDIGGRLGTSYDATVDKLVEQHYFRTTKVQTPEKRSICKVFSGNRSSNLINYLEKMNFNDDLQQSIFLGIIKPSGVCSLIDYDQPINEKTRFLYYSYTTKIEESSLTNGKIDQIICRLSSSTAATHIITKIQWGIDILCIISTSDDQPTEIVDNLLQNISQQLENNNDEVILSDEERNQIRQLKRVTIYGSKLCMNDLHTSLDTVLMKLSYWKKYENYHHPLLYTMNSLRWIYNDEQFSAKFHAIDKMNSSIAKIQCFIKDFTDTKVNFEQLLEQCKQSVSNSKMNQYLNDSHSQFSILSETNRQFLEDYRQIIIKLRRNHCESEELDKIISDQRYSSLKTDLDTLYRTLEQRRSKVLFIERLKNDQIQFIDILDILSEEQKSKTFEEINAVIKSNLTETNCPTILWYSNDQLKQQKADEWEKIYQQFQLEKQSKTKEISLIYVDFTQCGRMLEDFIVITSLDEKLSSIEQQNPANESSSTAVFPQSSSPLPPTELNILLLGETGVGKSTFINAFVNYLMFDTLQEAEQGESTVVIPVSFLVTTGNEFDEVTVQFGDIDPNENHQSKGQSVTQHCRSYIIDLNQRLRLRLIDSPGIGDTRGFDQDEINMNHTLTYINQLTHLNAVLLLLKPNNSKLNVLMTSCLRQLLTYLTPSGYGNIIFCFTNSRSTHFSPGNTGPLLKRLLKDEQLQNILFERKNTFFFDSESFRYLAARKCNIEFEDYIKQESIDSWKKSVTESIQMLNFIRTLQPYELDKHHLSRKVALDVLMLARPLMEVLRLTYFNWKLLGKGRAENEMIIKANPIDIDICSNCAESIVKKIGLFDIFQYGSTKSENATTCHCPCDEKHFLIECIVEHHLNQQRINSSSSELKDRSQQLLFKCDRLTHFLQQNRLINKNDPFSSVLKRFLDEQQRICDMSGNSSTINKELRKILCSLSEEREKNRNQLLESNEKLSLDEVYTLIEELMSISEIKQQIECIKTSRQLISKANERQIKIPSIKNKSFAELTNWQQ